MACFVKKAHGTILNGEIKSMNMHYTVEENTRVLISLLKQYGIKKIIASPGTKNISFVGSVQNDDYFEVYSSVDERSAAYIACGMAAESGECVCLSCTGATASRNYIPGLTEAYYRKLPIIAITSAPQRKYIGHNMDQVIDRRAQLNDMVRYSAYVPVVRSKEDRWECEIEINKALIATKRHGGGPVHINLETATQRDVSVTKLDVYRKINYYSMADAASFPAVEGKRIAVFIGNHNAVSPELENSITQFCKKYDAVVLCDRTSNYYGKYRVVPSMLVKQDCHSSPLLDIDLMIHIGNTAGSQFKIHPEKVWRINEDGEIRDTFKRLTAVFECSERFFFDHYARPDEKISPRDDYYNQWKKELERLYKLIPELPFSNPWVAQQSCKRLSSNSIIHLGILNSLRSWNYFDSSESIMGFSNTGGFGIDGCISSTIGGAIACKGKIHYLFIGDLAFFYDMNSLGNRHVPDNIRIAIINNGRGVEFRKYNHPGSAFGEDADRYMAAAGHFGRQSRTLIKDYVSDLGFRYLSATTKDEFLSNADVFFSEKNEGPIVFEIFTDYHNDDEALKMLNNVFVDMGFGKKNVKNLLGEKGMKVVKELLK